ncbi:hypothetical protein KP509_1Z323900 [Ceratopteris richardii]|nr:hypothetical protein KP509_1Z323900 [Ceratopteris richardii]
MLHPKLEAYTESDMEALIVSLEEFIQTAPLGEYRRRVEMLEGFYAEFSSPKLCSDTHPDSLSSTINRILYNLSCYYSQFLPLVEEAISSAKRTVASELGDLVKLQKWDDRNYYTLTSSNETTHRKLFKLISKYKVLLTKPALATVMDNNQKWCSVSERIAAGGPQKSCPEGPSEMHPLKLDDYEYNDGSANECWKIFFVSKSQDLVALTSSCSSHLNNWEVKELSSLFSRFGDLLNASILSQDVIQSRQRGTDVLEKLALTVITRSNELRNSEQKQMVKKKALVDLIRALRAVGLSHHRSAIPKKERSSKAWIAHVPCKVDPLLNLFIKFSHGKGDGGGSASFIPDYLSNVSCLWKKACDYFYKNLVLAQKLQHLRLSFHKDLTLQEVGALMAYLEHGIFIQKKQRIFSYEFSLKLLSLQSVSWNLTTIGMDTKIKYFSVFYFLTS